MEKLEEVKLKVIVGSNFELNAAIEKHGLQEDVSLEMQYMITSEEFGEVAKDLIDGKYENAKTEINQTVAMLIKLYWLIEKNE